MSLKYPTLAFLTLISFGMLSPVLAENVEPCKLILAVSYPPMTLTDSIMFNVTNEKSNNAILLDSKNPKGEIKNLVCSDKDPYSITATYVRNDERTLLQAGNQPIGVCKLRAGSVFLSLPGNSAAVVYPYDFEC